ncbi:MAG: AgmX/PglI C-terminal domain-containing protein [Myxococcales bacterium]|nr:AgmX/PglI C-terminal domain-containing protein [Myxococcota bacterium]MDW8283558.1 AgmX/PglI C-terminal domain-containing protein [Myxococcales bacterium]
MRSAAALSLAFSFFVSVVGAFPPSVVQAEHVRLTIVGARLDSRHLSPSGAPRSTTPLSDLACLSLPGLRPMADACGGAQPDRMAHRPGVDPLVRIELGDRIIRTYPVPGSLEPRWDYAVLLDAAQIRHTRGAVRVQLQDYIAPGSERVLGRARLRPQDLLRPGEHRLSLGGAELTYRIERVAADAPPRHYRFRVPATEQMADLARRAAAEDPTCPLIPVAEGELVRITARGQVRPNARKYPQRVAGPAGIPTILEKIQYNQPGFRGCSECNHVALIAQLGTRALVIGERKEWVADSAGYLLLGVNDLKVSDNDGAFDVEVNVSVPPSAGPAKLRGSAEDAPPSAMDPRVVQQTVDAHGAELDECCAQEPNPYGEVVLVFSISADGSPLGVVVERASPNLQRASECMRRKALQWRFPPPRGVVTARYPISFSPG